MKRLVVCFDGTWNSADQEGSETNVARIARSIRATSHGGPPQMVLYLRGVGSTGLAAQRVFDGAFGHGVDDNIRSGYMFLAQNYEEGDEIYLFGFSRGAFTARSLAGFIGCCGLLRRRSLGHLASAWQYYRTEVERTREGFCRACTAESDEVEIKFLGVWDTVGALGVPTTLLSHITRQEYSFHDTSPSRIVKNACHALAIDEHRDEFVPTLWTGQAPEGVTIEQVWFAGAHADVGGGYENRTLADIPLLWMAEKAEASGLAIDFSVLPDKAKLDPHAPRHDSREGWSAKDRLTPTIRCIGGRIFNVTFYERLYAPVDDNGNLLPTINESIHPSVFDRLDQDDMVAKGKGFAAEGTYAPRNLELWRPVAPAAA
jgi:uncharacterized protein (DUF2235 family)